MFRTILNAAILPLELMSVGISSSELSASTTGWLLGATVLTTCPTAVEWARRLFGDGADLEERSPTD